jgi:UDP-glucose 4-epimerase
MKILVLGSGGFIGSNAFAYFQSKGYDVYSGDIISMRAKNHFLIDPAIPDFAAIFKNQSFDVCLNATGAANVQFSFKEPAIDFKLNTSNVYNILDSLKLYNPDCKFINLSSAAVYGNPTVLPINEKATINPLSPYGYHKWYSEQICKQFHDLFGLKTVSLRIFSAYGTGLKKQLFWDLYNKVDNAESEVELYGTGNESRDFIYITDILEAIYCVIENGIFDGTAINIASGTESNIKTAAEVFINASKRNLKLRFIGVNKIGDPLNWRGDISVLRSLGFNNKISLQEGIHKYCEWLERN